MVSVASLMPAVLLCVALLVPCPVEAASYTQWLKLIGQTFRTLFYYFLPSKRNQVNAIDGTLTHLTGILKGIMPVEAETVNFEISHFVLHSGYICMGHGVASNFQTFVKTDKVGCIWENDNSVNVGIPYTIEDFKVRYGSVYLKGFGMRKTGSLDLRFGKNKLILGVHIPNVLNMVGKLTGGDPCIVNITRLEFTQLGKVKVKLNTDGLTGGMTTTAVLNQHLPRYLGFLKTSVRQSFLANMYTKLSETTNTVCMGPEIVEEINRLGLLVEQVYTAKYYKYCENSGDVTSDEEDKHHQPSDDKEHKHLRLPHLWKHLRTIW